MSAWLQDVAYMNLELVAKYLMSKGDDVVTIGLDDTAKMILTLFVTRQLVTNYSMSEVII